MKKYFILGLLLCALIVIPVLAQNLVVGDYYTVGWNDPWAPDSINCAPGDVMSGIDAKPLLAASFNTWQLTCSRLNSGQTKPTTYSTVGWNDPWAPGSINCPEGQIMTGIDAKPLLASSANTWQITCGQLDNQARAVWTRNIGWNDPWAPEPIRCPAGEVMMGIDAKPLLAASVNTWQIKCGRIDDSATPVVEAAPAPVSSTNGVNASLGASTCPYPYHVSTTGSNCVWSCAIRTMPDNASNECVCETGYTQTGVDYKGRRTCSLTNPNSPTPASSPASSVVAGASSALASGTLIPAAWTANIGWNDPWAPEPIKCPDGDAMTGIDAKYLLAASANTWQIKCGKLNNYPITWTADVGWNDPWAPGSINCPEGSIVTGIDAKPLLAASRNTWQIKCGKPLNAKVTWSNNVGWNDPWAPNPIKCADGQVMTGIDAKPLLAASFSTWLIKCANVTAN